MSARDQRAAIRNPERYGAILRAAIQVFSRNGFFNSKVADIAREAGVADGTVYLYFKNKDHILVSIFEETMDEAISQGRDAIAGITDPAEKLKRIAGLHLDRMGTDRDLAIVFQVELRSSMKFMEQFSETRVSEYLELIRSVIQDGQKTGAFRRDLDANIASKVFFGALDEMVTNWVLSRKAYDPRSTASTVLKLFFEGVSNNAGAGGH
ncbi:MAG TPA: TetR/AcrR family transcriptional regulator [Blastocatellia bacterium]|nr:TetR/AcrR family transcriptional regulator [Blastocatellia bacterium]